MVSWPWQLFNCKDETMFSNKFRAKSCGFGFGRNNSLAAEQTTLCFTETALKSILNLEKAD